MDIILTFTAAVVCTIITFWVLYRFPIPKSIKESGNTANYVLTITILLVSGMSIMWVFAIHLWYDKFSELESIFREMPDAVVILLHNGDGLDFLDLLFVAAILFAVGIGFNIVTRLADVLETKPSAYKKTYEYTPPKPKSIIQRPFWAKRRDPNDPIRRG